MQLFFLALKNVLRSKFRTVLTVLGVAIAIVLFVLLRTVLSAWTAGQDFASKDRVVTRHKVTFIMHLPKRYVEDVRAMPEIKLTTFANWFGGKEPNHEKEFFAVQAVDGKTFFDVYDDMYVAPDLKERWLGNRRGAIVGDVLAKKMGWKIGDTVTIRGDIYPGDWQFQVMGFYEARSRVVDRSSFFFHWDYWNDSLAGPMVRSKDTVGWIVSRVKDPKQAASIGLIIDKKFDDRDIQTLSQDERAFMSSFLAGFSAILAALNIVSIAILLVMTLILGNTIAMGVRERTNEYAVLRAIGFMPYHLVICILFEALMIGLLGGAVGLGLSYPFVEMALGRWLEENMGSFFPFFRISGGIAAAAIGLAMGLAVLASMFPAIRAWRINVIQALRRVG